MPWWQLSSRLLRSAAQCQPQLDVASRTNITRAPLTVRGMDAAADAVAAFNDDDFDAVALKDTGSTEAGYAGSHHPPLACLVLVQGCLAVVRRRSWTLAPLPQRS